MAFYFQATGSQSLMQNSTERCVSYRRLYVSSSWTTISLSQIRPRLLSMLHPYFIIM